MSAKSRTHPGASDQEIGHGGELHQVAGGAHPPLTTQTGAIIFSHCKVVGATEGAQALLDMASVMKVFGANIEAFVTAASNGRFWTREPKVRTVY